MDVVLIVVLVSEMFPEAVDSGHVLDSPGLGGFVGFLQVQGITVMMLAKLLGRGSQSPQSKIMMNLDDSHCMLWKFLDKLNIRYDCVSVTLCHVREAERCGSLCDFLEAILRRSRRFHVSSLERGRSQASLQDQGKTQVATPDFP